MIPISVRVHAEDEHGNVYTLSAPIRYCGLTIPAGYESDGASVPKFFWRCVFPPGEPRALLAAFVHDYVYREHPEGWTKEEADATFFLLLREHGISPISAYLAYLGVKLFGGPAWRAGGKKS